MGFVLLCWSCVPKIQTFNISILLLSLFANLEDLNMCESCS